MSNITTFNASQVPTFAQTGELSDTAKALIGGALGNTTKRISIKGGVFRLVSGGKEMASIEDRHLDVIIVKAAPKVSRVFYAAKYDAENVTGPDCWSNDGELPDASAQNKQSDTCMSCKNNVAGSGQGNSRACRYQQRLAVVLENNPSGDILQLTLPATSIFGKEDGDKRPLQAYVRHLALASPPVDVEKIVTRMKFDMKSESPKLLFAPVRWLTADEYEITREQGESREASSAVNMTVAQTDGVKTKSLPILEGKPPVVEEDADEIIAPPPKAKKTKAEPIAEADEEPEIRKETKVSSVPAKKSKLADIVSDWDDE
jgi:hypothetical protein